MAYHPQTNGQTERTNRELGLALRIYCGNAPDQWSSLLSAFEYAHNQSVHSVTGKTPFELLYGYQPEGLGNVKMNPKHPATEERLRQLHRDRENTIAAHNRAAALMMKRSPAGEVKFKKGDKVLLEATNLRLPYPYKKLAPRRQGPFVVQEVIGPVDYRLKLPKTWKHHNVFHAAQLTPYHTTKEHGPDYPRPPPEPNETEEEEWEVEAIKNHRMTRGGQNYQFLVAWKGWPESENSWEPESFLRNASAVLEEYKRRHKLPGTPITHSTPRSSKPPQIKTRTSLRQKKTR